MVFNSYTFVVFFAVVVFLHHRRWSWRAKKANLLVASYLFYAAWNPPFVALLWISTLVDWFAARGIARSNRRGRRRLLLLASLLTNLGLLAIFKYGNFLLFNFVALLDAAGVGYRPPALDIVLPVGISFYTFQTLSYTLDIYRGKARPWHSFLDYALYVTFFPQLVAGPIVRAVDFLPQCREERRATPDQLGWGLSLLLLGLFLKVVVADGLMARSVEEVYDRAGAPGVLAAWGATLAFAAQIFCDFAGYSTCAIGAALCLGFSLPDNFRFPYAAIGFSDFWRRWHISLSTWLRDYLYIPLGGNRRGPTRTHTNLMFTMLLGGLWHGASWTFVVWGGLHGVYLAVEKLLRRAVPDRPLWHRSGVRLLLALATFALVCVTWVFFRAGGFGQALAIVSAMLGAPATAAGPALAPDRLAGVAVVTVAMLAIHWRLRDRSLESVVVRLPWWGRSVALAAMVLAIVMMPGEDRAFIYFQF